MISVTAIFPKPQGGEPSPSGNRAGRHPAEKGAEVMLVGANDRTRQWLAEELRLRGFAVCDLPPGRDARLRHDASCFSAVLMESAGTEDLSEVDGAPLFGGRDVTRVILPCWNAIPPTGPGWEGEMIVMGKPQVVDRLMAVLREVRSGRLPGRESSRSEFPEFR